MKKVSVFSEKFKLNRKRKKVRLKVEMKIGVVRKGENAT